MASQGIVEAPQFSIVQPDDWLHRVVLVLLLCFGTVMVFIVPPIQAPDEDSHFRRIIMLSEGNIFPVQQDGRSGQYLPDSLNDFVASHKTMPSGTDKKYSYQKWYLEASQPASSEPRTFLSYSGQSLSPLAYLPQLMGVMIGKALHWTGSAQSFNWPAKLYFARLGNLFVFAVLSAALIKRIPRFRAVVSGVVLLPMTVHLAASCSYDTTPLLTSLWLLGIVTKLAVDGKAPNRRQMAILAVAAFFLGHVKVVYAPLLLVVFALRRSMPPRMFLLFGFALLASAFLGALSGTLIFGMPSDASLKAAVSGQIGYVVANPPALPRIALQTIRTMGGFYFESALGNLGWLDTNFARPVLVFVSAILFTAFLSDAMQGPAPLGVGGGLGAAAGACLSACAIMLSMYLYWTSLTKGIGAPYVDGVQGRYFLPILPFVAAAIAGVPTTISGVLAPLRASLIEVQMSCQAAILLLMLLVVVARFWFVS